MIASIVTGINETDSGAIKQEIISSIENSIQDEVDTSDTPIELDENTFY